MAKASETTLGFALEDPKSVPEVEKSVVNVFNKATQSTFERSDQTPKCSFMITTNMDTGDDQR